MRARGAAASWRRCCCRCGRARCRRRSGTRRRVGDRAEVADEALGRRLVVVRRRRRGCRPRPARPWPRACSTAARVSLLPAPARTGTRPSASSSVISTTRSCSSAGHGGALAGGAAGHEDVDALRRSGAGPAGAAPPRRGRPARVNGVTSAVPAPANDRVIGVTSSSVSPGSALDVAQRAERSHASGSSAARPPGRRGQAAGVRAHSASPRSRNSSSSRRRHAHRLSGLARETSLRLAGVALPDRRGRLRRALRRGVATSL